MQLFKFFIGFVSIFALVVKAAPIVTTKFDLTDTFFESACGDQGVFVSGVFHQGFRTECTTQSDGFFNCRLDSIISFSNAVVLVDNVTWRLVEASHNTNFLIIGQGDFSYIQRSILIAQVIQPGTGVVRTFFGNLKCNTVNGVADCKVNTFVMEC